MTLHMQYFKCFLSKYLALNFLLHLSHAKDSITCWPCFLILWASYTCFFFGFEFTLPFLTNILIFPLEVLFLVGFQVLFLGKFLVGAGPLITYVALPMNRLYVILQIISFTFGKPHTEDTDVTLVFFSF